MSFFQRQDNHEIPPADNSFSNVDRSAATGRSSVYNPSNTTTYSSSRDGPDSSAGVGGPHSGIGGGHLDSDGQRLFADYTSDRGAGGDRFTDLYGEGTGGYGYGRPNLNQAQQNSRVQARSRFQPGKKTSDDESEDELDDGYDKIAEAAERERAKAKADADELDRQLERLERIAKRVDMERAKANADADELDRQQERLKRIAGSTTDPSTEIADHINRAAERLKRV